VADGETGLSYNYFRSYDSRTGRYTQADPIGLGGGLNRFSYVGGNPLSRIDPLGLDDFPVIFSGGAGTLWVVPPGSTSAEGFSAANNTTSTSRGAWAPGTYKYGYSTTHKDDAPGSSYGSNGNTVFNVPGCVGCGVHSGREYKADRKGGSGVQHVTEGCIRTTDDATQLIQDLIRQGHRPVLEVTR
jgi:RHS repeat-associated protein